MMAAVEPSAVEVSPRDYLQLARNKRALKALAANSALAGQVLLSLNVTKINRRGKSQTRVLLVTTRHVLNLMPDNYAKCNRCIPVARLSCVSTCAAAREFVIHVESDYDYHFKSQYFVQAVAMLSRAYAACSGKELRVSDMSVRALATKVTTKPTVLKDKRKPSVLNARLGLSGVPFVSKSTSGLPVAMVEDSDEGDDVDDTPFLDIAHERSSVGDGDGASAVGGAFSASKSRYNVEDFEMLKVLGKGAFGKVMLVKARDHGTVYAMKVLSKAVLLERNEVTHTRTERKTLEDTHHPFLVHLRFAFQSPSKLFLVMDYCCGGELFYHLKCRGRFDEPRARLYAAEIASALSHLHSRKVIYRDLKPENVLLDSDGHVRLTDFGLAKDAMELSDKTHTFCGTPDYLAPEVIRGGGHGRGVDWWSLGTMIYEMLGGLPPYYSENVNAMYEKVLRAPLEFRPETAFSSDARDLLHGLLQKEPEQRLGSSARDGEELREHRWFAPIDWAKLERRELEPPFKPEVGHETDVSNFDEEFTSEVAQESFGSDSALSAKAAAAFAGFTYTDASALA